MMEGAGFWQKSIFITLPCIRPIIAPSAIMTAFTTFKQFDIIYLLTKQKGSLTGASIQTIITYAHKKAYSTGTRVIKQRTKKTVFKLISESACLIFRFLMNFPPLAPGL